MRSNEKSVSASARVSIRQRRQQAITSVPCESTRAGEEVEDVGTAGGNTAPETPAVQPLETESATSRAKRIAAQGGLAALFHDALVKGQRQAREERDAQDAAPPANLELLAAIERSLLCAKQERLCFDCGKYPATTRSGLCSRCYVFNKC